MEQQINEYKKYIANFFTKVTPLYDEEEPRFFNYFGNRLEEQIEIKPNCHILDIACGRGAVTLNILKNNSNINLTGIDLCAGMVETLKKDLDGLDFSNVEIKEMDAEHLDFDDNSFDYVFCGFGVFFFPDFNKAFKEIHRVLKRDGIFAFSTFKGFQEYNLLQDILERYVFQQPDQIVSASKKTFNNKENIQKILKSNGLDTIKILDEKKTFIYKDKEQWWNKQLSHGMRRKIDEIDKNKIEEFKQEVFSRLDTVKTDKGFELYIDVLYTYAVKK